jgi:hypothetical protein
MAAATWKTMNAPIHVKKNRSARLRNTNLIGWLLLAAIIARPGSTTTRVAAQRRRHARATFTGEYCVDAYFFRFAAGGLLVRCHAMQYKHR